MGTPVPARSELPVLSQHWAVSWGCCPLPQNQVFLPPARVVTPAVLGAEAQILKLPFRGKEAKTTEKGRARGHTALWSVGASALDFPCRKGCPPLCQRSDGSRPAPQLARGGGDSGRLMGWLPTYKGHLCGWCGHQAQKRLCRTKHQRQEVGGLASSSGIQLDTQKPSGQWGRERRPWAHPDSGPAALSLGGAPSGQPGS